MVINYNESTVYKLCCKDVSVKEIYVGSTTNFIRRKYQHKSICNNVNDKSHNSHVYIFIRETGGFDNWDMIEVEKYNAKDKKDLEKRERFFIEDLGASLNNNIPSRTKKEYYEENKEYLNELRKKYYEANKEQILEDKKKYYEDNKDQILEVKKKYREDNKDQIIEQKKKYYEANKGKIAEGRKEKVTCECGSIISKHSLSRHIKSKKHQNII